MEIKEEPTNETEIVVDIQDGFAFVEVEKGEICNACKLKSLCFLNKK
jgi:positive regulator of sigma E activity